MTKLFFFKDVAARVAGEMKFLAEEPNKDLISQKIYEVTRNPEDQNVRYAIFLISNKET